MNTLINRETDKYDIFDGSVDQLIDELSDPSSVWYDLKLAEMSGYDYIFAPDAICRQINGLEALSKFMSNIQTILGTEQPRTILLSYWHDRYRELHFEKYDLKWDNKKATDWQKILLDDSPQLDYIRTIYDYSEQLILT